MCTGAERALAFFELGISSKYGILFKGGVTIEATENVKAVVMTQIKQTCDQRNFVVQSRGSSKWHGRRWLLKLCAVHET